MDGGFLIAFDEMEGGRLRAQVTGVRSVDATIGYWEAILARIAEARPAGLMVMDELVGEELSASEWKQLVTQMVGRGLEGIPLAHVKPFTFDQINYCEKYANDAGLEARAFRREADAVAWLRAHAG